jgi:drug/metabolite transporter (DMT)-like permease
VSIAAVGRRDVLLGEIAAMASAALWAVSSSIMAGLARRMPALAVSALRLCSGTLFYLALLIGAGKAGAVLQIGWYQLLALGGSALLSIGIGDTLYIGAMQRIGVGRASPISVTSYPLMTVLLAALLLDEVITPKTAAGGLLVLAGILLVVVRPQPAPSLSPEPPVAEAGESFAGDGVAVAVAPRPAMAPAAVPWFGIMLVLIASATWACSTVWLRTLTEDTSLIVVNAVRIPVTALFLSSIAYGRGAMDLRRYGTGELGLIAFAGLIGAGVGSLLYVYALDEAGAGRSALLNSLSPVFALPIAALFLKERITALMVAGTVLALAGVSLFIG